MMLKGSPAVVMGIGGGAGRQWHVLGCLERGTQLSAVDSECVPTLRGT